jgi:Trehalose utilisation
VADIQPRCSWRPLTGHHANGLKPKVTTTKGAESHPIVAGVQTPFTGQGSLYKTGPLAASTRALLLVKIAGQPVEPVAWVNLVGSSRVFYTSLGHPGDFDNTAFRRLLRNAVFWAMNRQPSGGQSSTSTSTSMSRSTRSAKPEPPAASGARPPVDAISQAGLSPSFGLEDTHSVVNSLRWRPDGWIYAAQGSTVTGHVTRPGLDQGKEPAHTMGQLISSSRTATSSCSGAMMARK